MISPEISVQIEYTPFSVTFTISSEDPEILPEIESVSITASDGNDHSSNIVVTITSPTTVNLSGVLSDVFNRGLYFIAADGSHKVVSKYSDIPADFQTLYQYIAPVVNSIDLTVNVLTTEGSETATIVVENNFSVANAKLAEYVAKGQY